MVEAEPLKLENVYKFIDLVELDTGHPLSWEVKLNICSSQEINIVNFVSPKMHVTPSAYKSKTSIMVHLSSVSSENLKIMYKEAIERWEAYEDFDNIQIISAKSFNAEISIVQMKYKINEYNENVEAMKDLGVVITLQI